MYTPLHIYSHYSILQGLNSPKDIIEEAKNRGHEAVALTDINNMSGAIEFYKEAKSNKIKPIIGSTINTDKGSIVLLALNKEGYVELLSLVATLNTKEHFKGSKLEISIEELSKFDFSNIVCLTGHEDSTLYNCLVHKYKIKEAYEDLVHLHIQELLDFIPQENLYIELQFSENDHFSNNDVKKLLIQIGQKYKLSILSSPRVYFLNKEDKQLHQILISAKEKQPLDKINQINNKVYKFFSDYRFYLPTEEEFKNCQYIEETNKLADKVEDYNLFRAPSLPTFPCPEGFTSESYFKHLVVEGWLEKLSHLTDEEIDIYALQVHTETQVFKEANLFDYFLIVHDIINYAKSKGYLLGAGRGSVGGCITAYLLGITQIDSIKYNLLFERFYNQGRNDIKSGKISLPDIDMDFPAHSREDIINYIIKKYGKSNVTQIATYGTLMGRAALKAVFRAYNDTSFSEQNEITKHIPDKAKISDKLQEMKNESGYEATVIQWALQNKKRHFEQWCIYKDGRLDGPLSNHFEKAIKLEGVISTASKHAAGVVVGPSDLSKLVPLIYDEKTERQIIGCPMTDLDFIGLCKMDILGISSLDRLEDINKV